MYNSRSFFKIFLILTILYLAFQTKPWTNIAGNIYGGDDNSYYAYVSSLVNDFDFDFSNNDIHGDVKISPVTGKVVLAHPIGTSLFLVPFYAVAKPFVLFIHWIEKTPFDQRHPVFFMFMSAGILLYAYLGGCFLWKAIVSLGINTRIADTAVILTIWGTILPAYIFKRPIFSPIPQFFLISLLLYWVIRWNKNILLQFKHVVLLGLVSGAILITRWNDLHIVVFALYFLCVHHDSRSHFIQKGIPRAVFFLLLVFAIFFFTQGLAWKYFSGGYFILPYDPTIPGIGFVLFSGSTLLNFIHIFIGLDWGLIYTMLPFVFGLIALFWFDPLMISPWRLLNRIAYTLLFSLPFIIVLTWRQQGSYYGYRHLLSLLPFVCVGLAVLLDRLYTKFPSFRKFLAYYMIVIVTFNFFLILPFEYDQSTTLELGVSVMGGGGWINDFYVINAIKIYFSLSAKMLAGLFVRGFLGGYVFGGIYLLSPNIFSNLATMDAKIQQYYALDSPEKWVVLLYPLLVISMLITLNIFMNKKYYSN